MGAGLSSTKVRMLFLKDKVEDESKWEHLGILQEILEELQDQEEGQCDQRVWWRR